MYKILLACSAGMSTSLLVNNMKKEATAQGIEAEIQAMPAAEAETVFGNWDIVLLGPQVRYMLKGFQAKGNAVGVPVDIIDMKMYGMMDGKGVLAQAMKMIENK